MKFNLLTDATENEVTLYLERSATNKEVMYLWATSSRGARSDTLLMEFTEDGTVSLVPDCSGALRSLGFAVESADGIDRLWVH